MTFKSVSQRSLAYCLDTRLLPFKRLTTIVLLTFISPHNNLNILWPLGKTQRNNTVYNNIHRLNVIDIL